MISKFNFFVKKLTSSLIDLVKLNKWLIHVIPGILVIGFFYTFTFISLAFYPSPFSPVNNWLSDLGDSSYNPNGAFLYNLGCILTGSALFPFYIGMYKFYREEIYHKIAVIGVQILGCFSAFALIMLGVFSQDFSIPHMIWSGLFFWFNLWVLVGANLALMFHKDFMKPIAIYGWSAAGINFLFVLLTVSMVNSPLLEWISVSTALGYVALIIFNIYKNRSEF